MNPEHGDSHRGFGRPELWLQCPAQHDMPTCGVCCDQALPKKLGLGTSSLTLNWSWDPNLVAQLQRLVASHTPRVPCRDRRAILIGREAGNGSRFGGGPSPVRDTLGLYLCKQVEKKADFRVGWEAGPGPAPPRWDRASLSSRFPFSSI